MNDLGNKLKELRGSQSQREMAEPLGIKYQQWAKYERGEVSPGADMLKQICLVHSCSADWILGLPERSGTAAQATAHGAHAIAVAGTGARVTVGKGATQHPNCATCKYKRLADAFKAL